MVVQGVPTIEHGGRLSRVEEKVHTYGAVRMHASLQALVVILERSCIAHDAGVTVVIIFAPTNATETTAFAVENLLLCTLIIEKIADATKEAPKAHAAAFTVLLHLLAMLTDLACELSDIAALKFVHQLGVKYTFILHLIVTNPA
jgi:hypothetical protein